MQCPGEAEVGILNFLSPSNILGFDVEFIVMLL
jgi:hypothetical protein